MPSYEVRVETVRPLPTMDVLLDGIEAVLKANGLRDGEWEMTVHGPPELRIGVTMR